ncbi:MAG: hypothetical protein U1E05_08045 [Patescibacteria group bacterium]|nr:hypothetical protein [Patescibacteria group bacterium]
MNLRAKIGTQNSHVKHKEGEVQLDGTIIAKDLPSAAIIEIVEEGTGVYLYRYDKDERCVGDTWHLTIAEAKGQAEFEYGVASDDWVET